MAGKTDLETALIDMYGAQLGDLFDEYAKYEHNDQSAFASAAQNQTWSKNLRFFEQRILKNRLASGFLVGSSLSWADLYLAQIVEFIDDDRRRESVLAGFPNVKSLIARIRDSEQVADWIRRRPQTDS